MSDPNNPCLFCDIKKVAVLIKIIWLMQVMFLSGIKSSLLIIPKRHVSNYFDLNNEEIIACNDLIKLIKQEILDKDKTVEAFNIGVNTGKIAGQSIMHCHIHLIPRREGDVENPQGGVRSVIPSKQHYTRKNK